MKRLAALASMAIMIASFASLAHAEFAPMSQFVGRYNVKNCTFTQNFKAAKKDYYCRAKEFSLSLKADGSYSIRMIDELNQDRVDIVMTEYKKDQKDGTLEQATFDSTSKTSANWTLTTQGNDQNNRESREFNISDDGTVRYSRYINYYTNTTYKTAEWLVDLVKIK